MPPCRAPGHLHPDGRSAALNATNTLWNPRRVSPVRTIRGTPRERRTPGGGGPASEALPRKGARGRLQVMAVIGARNGSRELACLAGPGQLNPGAIRSLKDLRQVVLRGGSEPPTLRFSVTVCRSPWDAIGLPWG